jgi:hypothetical protein
MRTKQTFLNIIRDAIEKAPGVPVRLDVHIDEQRAILAAFDALGTRLTFTLNEPAAKRKLFDHLRRAQPSWRLWRSTHIDPEKRDTGTERVAIFPPDYVWPQPVERVLVAKVQETIRRRDKGALGREMQARIQSEWGPDYHVELHPDGIGTVGGDPQLPGGLYCRIWKGVDWLACHHAEFYAAEVASAIEASVKRIEYLEPDAKRGRAQVVQCRTNASIGGKAAAHYTDAEIESAFKEYKRRNPGRTAWDAAQALIRNGQPLDGYKTVTGPWNRTERIADRKWTLTREEWFEGL